MNIPTKCTEAVPTNIETPAGVIFLPDPEGEARLVDVELRWAQRSPIVQELGQRCLACLRDREAAMHEGIIRRFGAGLCAGQVALRAGDGVPDAVVTGSAMGMVNCRSLLDGGAPMPVCQTIRPVVDAHGRAEYVGLVN